MFIPRRFNGPLHSGNGGYCCGAIARLVGEDAEVNLRSPVPLDRKLDVTRDPDGAVRVTDGETHIADGHPAAGIDSATPEPVGREEARRAAQGYEGLSEGEFSRCFVCGRAREDALGVFAGPVAGRDVVASPWAAPDWAADQDGNVSQEIVWSVLDCPTYFALYIDRPKEPSVLARMSARILAPVKAGEVHVVIAWPVETDGRKQHAGSAVLSADGEPLAVARALLIAPRQ